MAYVRRHWLSSVLYSLIILFGLAIVLTPILVSDKAIKEALAQVEPTTTEPEPIDPYLYTRVQQLRQELSLTNFDLAAMGCDEESATQILESLKSWCRTNQATLDQNHRDTLQAKATIREAIRQINIGPAPGSEPNSTIARSLPGLQKDLVNLLEQRKSTLDGLAAQIETTMDTSKRHIWQSARANVGMPTQLRYVPDLSDEQRQTIHNLLTERAPQESIANVGADELTWSQKQAADAAGTNLAIHNRDLRNAEAAVLPIPDMLKESEELNFDVLDVSNR